MGNAVPTAILTTTLASSRKRKREEDDEEAHSTAIVEETPARKKSRATSLYIYETMFVQGANTDVVIAALGKEWRLHRIYLCQSSYFCALFNGHWKDSNDPRINIEIVDPNINVEALHATFGSFYKDDVSLTSENVISILATSRMFHLEGLLQQCADFMSDHVDPETVCGFHQAAHQYAVEAVESQCFEWLQERLLTIQSVSLLREVSEDLLCRLVQSSGLFVMQVEMDLYTLAKQWLYLQLFPQSSCTEMPKLQAEADAHFASKREDSDVAFLDTKEGKLHRDLFKGIRFQHIINDVSSVRMVDKEAIVPQSWLLPLYKRQWLRMLATCQNVDLGPSTMSEDIFDSVCLRCGRILPEQGEYCWRWTGYFFGIDVLVSLSNGCFTVKRNAQSQPCLSPVSLQPKRSVMLKLTALSFDGSDKVVFRQSTGLVNLVLSPDQEIIVMVLDKSVRFPLHLSASLAVVSEESNGL
eukprot:m.17109 g.17109  ORF g.17109 m.17109 type:complete len:470 (+) comp27320_c0_seq3:51-1460(+)